MIHDFRDFAELAKRHQSVCACQPLIHHQLGPVKVVAATSASALASYWVSAHFIGESFNFTLPEVGIPVAVGCLNNLTIFFLHLMPLALTLSASSSSFTLMVFVSELLDGQLLLKIVHFGGEGWLLQTADRLLELG